MSSLVRNLTSASIPKHSKVSVASWYDPFRELSFNIFSNPHLMDTLGKWQAFVDYLHDGGEAYVHYQGSRPISNSIGKLTLETNSTNILDIVKFGEYSSIRMEPVFKITFDETRTTDNLIYSSGLRTKLHKGEFQISFTKPKHCYLTTSTYYKKNISKDNIVYDRYGTQITEGCYVLAAIPGKPPAIESGKITHITDAGILWFQKLGSEGVLKGTLRAKSCVVISNELVDNIIMEKLSS